ncbi:MAG: MBL fold metallo-hydrolase, partial [Wenzhouxiangellaceae bacterium]
MADCRLSPALCGAVFALCCAFPVSAQYLRVYYPDIEQGSATLVVAPTGNALLVDAGTGIRSSDEGIENFINDLIDAGIVTRLDFIVATHYDEDHIGRMENVFQLVPLPGTITTYDRGEFMQVPFTFAYSDYSFGASQHNRVTVPACAQHALGGGVSFKIWTVNGDVCNGPVVDVTGADQFENNVSVSLVVQYGDVDLWIGGDLTGNPGVGVADVESPTGMEVMDVDIYTVNHHGSETSSNAGFLADLAAEVAINQNSMENNFGHPRATVVSRFKATPDSFGQTPVFYQQNPGDPGDSRSDDSLADGIADCDDAAAGGVFGLPGTIELISDGASYRIHACAIAATTFPADSGAGAAGAYPPAIRSVQHGPRVPLASETVLVQAVLEDLTAAEVRYSINGVAQAPVQMNAIGGGTWTASLPAQPDGVRVDYRVAASNATVQGELSRRQCYFSGTTPIALLRDQDADGVLATKTCAARVEGVMTAEPGVFHEFVTIGYVQDATGGIQIFDGQIDPAIRRGDRVEWIGEIEQFGAQAELVVAEPFGNFGYTRLGADTPPAPQVLTVAQVGEASEGQLIRINNVFVTAGAIPETGTGNLTISDNGIDTLTLRIDDTTDLPGSNTPTGTFDIIGISSQFDSWVPLTGGYQVLPRGKADVLSDEVNFPQVIINEILVDPATGASGDANGDGTRSATEDEFVEL